MEVSFSPTTRKGTAVLTDKISCTDCPQILCRQIASTSDVSKRGPNFMCKTLDASACSEDSSQECLSITAATATAAARHIRKFCFREHQETGARKRAKVPQQTTQNDGESGSCGRNTHSHDTFCARPAHSQNAPHRCFHSRNTRGSRLRIAVSLKQLVIPASCLACCRTCHRALLHDLCHLHQLSSDHLLPH